MPARVASAEETSACERETIEAGTPSSELMRRAGHRAADVIKRCHDADARRGVVVFAGSGNNGGDGWVVAEALASSGYRVRVVEIGKPRSNESVAARELALASGVHPTNEPQDESMVVDALLGTGSTGSPKGAIAAAISRIDEMRLGGATVVALDLPSGLDATTGESDGSVRADMTVTFGVLKRGHLIARDVCGEIFVADIGLTESAVMSSLPVLVDRQWVAARVPPIRSSAHKGTRKSLAIVGGGKGMAGATILSGEGALRSGIGLLRIVCASESEVSVHAGIPSAIVHTWPRNPEELQSLAASIDCVALGPGLGKSSVTRELVERILLSWNGPSVLDADALNDFENDVSSLATLLRGRAAVLTPHPAEMARLVGGKTADILAARFEVGRDLAKTTGAAVLLKGSPTIVFSPSGDRFVVASGTAALATGGSGDVLTGIVGTLLAQMPESPARATDAAACAAFVHGRAAELCGFVRGTTLDDVLHALPPAWSETPRELPDGIIAELQSHS
jgi:NAD(P)H-hydrate epimerase